jgi:preprotein translocase subunit SecD
VAPPSGNASRPGRALAALAAVVVVLLLAIVGGNIASPAKWSHDFKVRLGLDLTSGTEVALKAVPPSGRPISSSQMSTLMSDAIQIMQNRVNGAGFTEAQVQQQGTNIINVSVPGANSEQTVVKLVSTTASLDFRQVMLLAPNTAVTAPTPTPSPTSTATSPASPSPSATSTKSSIHGRSTPSPSASAGAAGVPGAATGGLQEMAHAARGLAAASPSPSASATPSPSASPTASAAATATPTPSPIPTLANHTTSWQQAGAQGGGDAALLTPQTRALFNKLDCANKNWQKQIGYTAAIQDNPGIQIVSCGLYNGVLTKFALDKAAVLGKDIKNASAAPQTTSTSWVVNVNFDGTGTSAFGKVTTAMFQKYQGSQTAPQNILAVVLDGRVISPDYIIQSIVGGQAQISGNFDQKQATDLATQLTYGSLPLTFHQQSIESVSPQLGHDQLNAGLVAAGLGLILVVFYLLFYYRGLAIISVSSLVIAALLAYLAVVTLGKYQGFALNLAGIAGLIVAIGITADSFVVFFERLRDEVRDGGRSLRAAVERGWGRARRTILVSDTVSFLAAALLYYFAIGEVRGFAFTLGLTTIIDVLVVFTFTKPMMTLLARTKFFGGGHPMSGLDPVRLGARAPWRGTPRTAPRAASARASRPSQTKEA